ncbi:hypothetical protein K3G39_19195 [Pontibacter sp. HSC-14F20]|uniref:hypothetical protein n=1 Tax=Pontibacter sp. HSC-14F20 TaxID=2864136 RepID=UPI001C73AA3A|nr:hypothetical protein [Pontibacter sp. HSC-14F20]MBX0335367.1 hypothetical protein [Pontibacter sp. HSC-14F20]
MKQLLLLPLLLLAGHTLRAQTFEEWFRQKKTQKEYLVQQIAALQAYAGTLQQGYALVREGLQTVHTIKTGDLGLHQAFFLSLQTVNPALARVPELQDLAAGQLLVEKAFTQARSLPLLQAGERAYLEQVRATVLTGLAADLEAILQTLTAGEQELSDAARLERIHRLQAGTREKVAFAQAFLAEVRQLALLRARQEAEAARLRQTHGLPSTKR